MKYLTRDGSKSYHLMNGGNTYCKMWQAGGMNKRKTTWRFSDDKPEKHLCTMCQNVINKYNKTY